MVESAINTMKFKTKQYKCPLSLKINRKKCEMVQDLYDYFGYYCFRYISYIRIY